MEPAENGGVGDMVLKTRRSKNALPTICFRAAVSVKNDRSATIGAATGVLALLVSSQFFPTTAQTPTTSTMTATASAPTKSDACKAYYYYGHFEK
jgi:hypothetical protein